MSKSQIKAQNFRLVARIKRMESKVLAKPSYWFPDADGVGSALVQNPS